MVAAEARKLSEEGVDQTAAAGGQEEGGEKSWEVVVVVHLHSQPVSSSPGPEEHH